VIRSDSLDHSFVEEVLAEPGGEHLLTCWSCGTCAATCLVRRFDAAFNPRVILRKAGLGLREQVLSSQEIWQCSACDACYPRCPKGIHISEVMKAIRSVAIRAGCLPPGPFAEVDEGLCSGCAVCTRACPYGAIERIEQPAAGGDGAAARYVAHVDHNLCMHCGVCVAACPTGAMRLEAFNDADIVARAAAGGWLSRPPRRDGSAPGARILAFVCQWSLRSDEQWQRLERLGDNVRVVNMPCSGRVDPEFVLDALAQGADGVIVAGCQEGECHYQRGTYQARARVHLLEQMLGEMGIPASRVRFVQQGALDRYVLLGAIADMARELDAAVPAEQSVAH